MNKKMETQDKKSKILLGNSTFRGLSNNTKDGPLRDGTLRKGKGKSSYCLPSVQGEIGTEV